jgi:hypothetical protein
MANPSHKPTEGTRAQVDALAGLVGLPQAEIAAIGCLRSSFRGQPGAAPLPSLHTDR